MAKIRRKVSVQSKSGARSINKNGKYLLIGLASLIAVLIIAFAAVVFSSHIPRYEYVAKVNGDPIQEKEFLRQLQLERAKTYEYFKQKYNADGGGNFWNTDFKGEVPIEYARDKALKECVNIKLQQALAREYGLIKDITYESFLKDLAKENKRRKDAIKNNQVIYGPQQYDENSYFTYVFSNMVIKLKDKLLENEYKLSDAQLMSFYEKVKDTFYKEEDKTRFQILYISYSQENGGLDESKRKEALEKMQEVKARVDKGETFEDVAKSDPNRIKIIENGIDKDSASPYSKSEPKSFEAARKLEVNQISDVLDEVMQRKVQIIKVLSKESAGYKALEEFKDSVVLNYISEKYDELTEKLRNEAIVEMNEKAYKKMNVQ